MKKLIFFLLIFFSILIFSLSFWSPGIRRAIESYWNWRGSYQSPPAGGSFQDDNPDIFAIGGIIPHHLLASNIIADFFEKLSVQNPKTIILIGPNHSEKGEGKALTDSTPGESILTPRGWEEWGIEIDNEVLKNEHSVSDIITFIKQHLPETSIFPIVLSNKISIEEIEVLAEKLSKIVSKDVVLIASVDFSHNLKSEDAQDNDLKTLEIIKNFDYPKLLPLNSDFLDGPSSIATLLATMKKLGKTNLEVLHHTNSSKLVGDSFAKTTSYFSIRLY